MSGGVLGWFGEPDISASVLESMAAEGPTLENAILLSHTASSFAVGASGLERTTAMVRANGLILALHGHPFWKSAGKRHVLISDVAALFLDAYKEQDVGALKALHGDYSLALVDPERRRLVLAVDRMSVRNIVYAVFDQSIAFGPTCDAISRHPAIRRSIDDQQIYSYLYFHVVPGPSTIFRGQHRVPSGHFIDFRDGSLDIRPHWPASFDENNGDGFPTLKHKFRGALEQAVLTAGAGERCGTFLSGGTDSSTIAGLLGLTGRGPTATFSIGFAEDAYDEMRYARIASRHFNTQQHEYYVTPDDVLEAVPRIVDSYDQPFGNASAIPTYYCAKLAKSCGIDRMLGGDGGDELFGGNSRYARQRQFARFEELPRPVRRGMLMMLRVLPSVADHATLLRKARNYVAQASLPMPDRGESYNLLLRLGPENVLTSEFLEGIDRDAPLRSLREVYAATTAKSLINRMLALDFKFTLADSDLPKVTRMCELAGVDVVFPMLDDDLIDFAARLAPDQKLHGTRLRHFFKEALKDFLPPETIAKEKHGFGLPVGVWFHRHSGLRAMAGDHLLSLRRRNIVRGTFIDRLLDEHLGVHPGYYGIMVWVLLMLELWFERKATN